MAPALPFIGPAISGVSSVIGGIKGKGAAKKEQKRVEEMMALIKPLLEAQSQGAQYALSQSKPFIGGAGQAMQDLIGGFFKPLAFGNRSAIDAFLSPERRAINQGFQASQQNVSRFAPRGGGRVSALVKGDLERQGKLSDLVFGARREGAQGMQQSAQQLGALGTGLLGAGLAGGQQGISLLQNQQGLAQRASEKSDAQLGDLGKSLGGLLGQIFQGRGGGSKSSDTTGGGGSLYE